MGAQKLWGPKTEVCNKTPENIPIPNHKISTKEKGKVRKEKGLPLLDKIE